MPHRVKCVYCDKTFDRDTVPNIKVGRRYSHVDCYEKNHNPDDDFKGKIYALIKELYGPDYDYVTIERQRANYIVNGYTNEDIYNSLYYHYKVKNGSIEESHGRIGIVPYVVREANSYFNKLKNNTEKIQKALNQKDKVIVVCGTENVRDVKNSRKIDLSKLE